MGSRVIVDRDPRPPLREGCVHTQEAGGLKMEGAPHCMVGAC